MDFNNLVNRSLLIRKAYHQLEIKLHGSEWEVEEDALAFLTDAALVGRLTMAHQKRWPTGTDPQADLEHKIAESIWWLMVLADRMGIDSEKSLDMFLKEKEEQFL
ncbi:MULTISPECIES: MazG-like protein [Niallia]|uniref:MazG-like protein n=1 Tax=Niallia TaxID=2837506 RepID=UPI001F321258|nr:MULTISPECIES: MazG-like protein [Niallia]MCF2650804.1 MazG-like protein [Niallia circulans]MCM3363565.1 MazG-like protein [Niallia sp. MER TA 168]